MTCRNGRYCWAKRAAPRPPWPRRLRRHPKAHAVMRFEQTIDAFASALVGPSRAPPLQTMGREGAPDSRRFAVYRNNIAVSLIAAIEARYPVARRLVGADFFRAMARAFVARSKPRSAVILHYGADFPDFIAEFDPARLGDLRLAFHPSARLLRSNHPAASIWAGHQGEGDVRPPEHWRGEETLVTRPHAEVLVRILPA